MIGVSMSPSDSAPGELPEGSHESSVFTSRFSEEERRELLSEDRSAQLGISAILALLIGIGMILGIISLTLITYLGI